MLRSTLHRPKTPSIQPIACPRVAGGAVCSRSLARTHFSLAYFTFRAPKRTKAPKCTYRVCRARRFNSTASTRQTTTPLPPSRRPSWLSSPPLEVLSPRRRTSPRSASHYHLRSDLARAPRLLRIPLPWPVHSVLHGSVLALLTCSCTARHAARCHNSLALSRAHKAAAACLLHVAIRSRPPAVHIPHPASGLPREDNQLSSSAIPTRSSLPPGMGCTGLGPS